MHGSACSVSRKVLKLTENNLNPVWNEPFYFLIDESDKNPTLNVGIHRIWMSTLTSLLDRKISCIALKPFLTQNKF